MLSLLFYIRKLIFCLVCGHVCYIVRDLVIQNPFVQDVVCLPAQSDAWRTSTWRPRPSPSCSRDQLGPAPRATSSLWEGPQWIAIPTASYHSSRVCTYIHAPLFITSFCLVLLYTSIPVSFEVIQSIVQIQPTVNSLASGMHHMSIHPPPPPTGIYIYTQCLFVRTVV